MTPVFEEGTVVVPVFTGKLGPRELTCPGADQYTVMSKVRQISFRILIFTVSTDIPLAVKGLVF